MPSTGAPPKTGLARAISGWREQAALAAGFLLLLLACGAAAMLVFRARDADALVTHTLEVRQSIQRLASSLTEAESAQRAYILTFDDIYRADQARARATAAEVQERLRKLTADNPAQQARLNEIAPLLIHRFEVMDQATAMARKMGTQRAVTLLRASGEGRKISAEIRTKLAAADADEVGLFDVRVRNASDQRSLMFSVMLSSAVLATVLMGGVVMLSRRYTRALVSANEYLRREIGERERIQAQLRQSQKMEAIGRLTGGVAHDFNNMLAIVIGSLDLARARLDDGPRVAKLIDSALEGARRGAALTKRLLAFSRLQPLDPKPVDVNKSVSDISNILFRTLGEGVKIETVLAAGLWRAELDAPQLESAILNLAVNARDAMPAGGKLTLETANTYLDQSYSEGHSEVTPGQYVMIAVTDTGTGMSQEVMANAFEPFFTTKPAGAGTGLGLSQVHGFVKQSGGHVKLYSEPGVGTTVKLYFPRLTKDAEAAEAVVQSAEPRDNTARTVLVVEDEAGVRGFIVEALRELGYKVIEAESGAVALAALTASSNVSLMLTDVVMPEMNGRQLADRVHLQLPNLPVLYMTGYTRNAIVHNGTLDAGTRLLTKPFTISELDAELRTLLPEKPTTKTSQP